MKANKGIVNKNLKQNNVGFVQTNDTEKKETVLTTTQAIENITIQSSVIIPDNINQSNKITGFSDHDKIDMLFSNFASFLKEKNRRYGNSVLNPKKVFSKLSSEEQIYVRLDDKISRIMNSDKLRKNDISDLFGYLALLMVSKEWISFDEFLD